jgi:hypothetical protein
MVDRAYTIAAWVRGTGGASGDYIICGEDASGSNHLALRLATWTSGVPDPLKVQFISELAGSGNQRVTKSLAYPIAEDGAWHHWAASHDPATGVMTLYIDGEPVVSKVGLVNAVPTLTTLTLGAEASGANAVPADLDEVRIYDYPLTDADVLALYLDGPSG